MGVLYEHWDPIINECFYVGISNAAEDKRPYDYSSHNEDYDARVANIRAYGRSPETRLVECPHLTKAELSQLEKLQITYWRDLIGNRLTNKTAGGEGALQEWTEELCDRQRQILTDYAKTPDGLRWRKNISEKLKEFYATENGKKSREQQKITREAFYSSPEGELSKEIQREKRKKFLSSAQGQKFCEKVSRNNREFYQSERGKEVIKNNPILSSEGQKLFFQTPAGIKKKQNQSKLMVERYSGEEGVLRRLKTSDKSKENWRKPEFRVKMMYRSWWNSNCRSRSYWGA